MDEPIEIVVASYCKVGDHYEVCFTLNGVKQAPMVVPYVDPINLVASIFKVIHVVADPVGPCANEIPC